MNRRAQEITRYGINGILATFVHYGALTFNLNVLNFPSAAVVNMVAAVLA